MNIYEDTSQQFTVSCICTNLSSLIFSFLISHSFYHNFDTILALYKTRFIRTMIFRVIHNYCLPLSLSRFVVNERRATINRYSRADPTCFSIEPEELPELR